MGGGVDRRWDDGDGESIAGGFGEERGVDQESGRDGSGVDWGLYLRAAGGGLGDAAAIVCGGDGR
jgi:hypothetical protein